jgi:transcriptional regulator
MAKPKTGLVQGTLDMLILRVLKDEPLHGYAVAQRIQKVSDEILKVEEGSLYPALYRLEGQGLVKCEWGASENNRRAKYYSITKTGRKQLEEETSSWERLAGAITKVLQNA